MPGVILRSRVSRVRYTARRGSGEQYRIRVSKPALRRIVTARDHGGRRRRGQHDRHRRFHVARFPVARHHVRLRVAHALGGRRCGRALRRPHLCGARRRVAAIRRRVQLPLAHLPPRCRLRFGLGLGDDRLCCAGRCCGDHLRHLSLGGDPGDPGETRRGRARNRAERSRMRVRARIRRACSAGSHS